VKKWSDDPHIQTLARKLKSLPGPLTMTAIVFGVVPLWSLMFMHRPWELLPLVDHWRGTALIFNFWVGPFAIALCALTRHKFLIPLFVIESCTMLLNTMFELTAKSPELMTLQWILIGAMILFTLFLLRTDALYPLMHGSSRPWRSRPRRQVGLTAALSSPEIPAIEAKVVVLDCSLNGMQFSGRQADLRPFFAGKKKMDQAEFILTVEGKAFSFGSTIAWIREEDGEQSLGVRIPNKGEMEAFFDVLPPKDKDSLPMVVKVFEQYWQKKSIRQVTVSVWTLLILAAFLIPFGKRHLTMTRNPSSMADSNYMKAGFGTIFLNGK
jgi:hypothetical protein